MLAVFAGRAVVIAPYQRVVANRNAGPHHQFIDMVANLAVGYSAEGSVEGSARVGQPHRVEKAEGAPVFWQAARMGSA